MRRAVVLIWLAGVVVVWNGVFDWYIAAGTHTYLRRTAAFAAGRAPEQPVMAVVMAEARRDGLIAATGWAGLALGAGAVVRRFAVTREAAGRPT